MAQHQRETRKPKVAIIVQARMQSTRLPEKVLLPVANKPLLAHHLERLRVSELPIIVATTTHSSDDAIVDLAQKYRCGVFRGSDSDVLDRYYHAALSSELDIVIRSTADCPLIDGPLIKKALQAYLRANDPKLYMSPCVQRTFPRGLDFEIFSFELLKWAHVTAVRPIDREHVTTHFYHPQNSQVHLAHVLSDIRLQDWRLCVDAPDDFALIKELVEHHQAHLKFGEDLLKLIQSVPNLKTINARIAQVSLT